jgi:hypothetical protein
MVVQFDIVSVTPARPLTAYKVAWCIALVFHFLEYVGRSAPAVMIRELTAAFDVSVVKLSAIIGSYYYTYAVASLLAGVSPDRRCERTHCDRRKCARGGTALCDTGAIDSGKWTPPPRIGVSVLVHKVQCFLLPVASPDDRLLPQSVALNASEIISEKGSES